MCKLNANRATPPLWIYGTLLVESERMNRARRMWFARVCFWTFVAAVVLMVASLL